MTWAKWTPDHSENPRQARVRRELDMVRLEHKRLCRLAKAQPHERVYAIARDARAAEMERLEALLAALTSPAGSTGAVA